MHSDNELWYQQLNVVATGDLGLDDSDAHAQVVIYDLIRHYTNAVNNGFWHF